MVRGGIGGFLNGNTRRINTAHLTGTNANGALSLANTMALDLTCFVTAMQTANHQAGHRLARFRHDLQS